jgi:hypothetical protein
MGVRLLLISQFKEFPDKEFPDEEFPDLAGLMVFPIAFSSTLNRDVLDRDVCFSS